MDAGSVEPTMRREHVDILDLLEAIVVRVVVYVAAVHFIWKYW